VADGGSGLAVTVAVTVTGGGAATGCATHPVRAPTTTATPDATMNPSTIRARFDLTGQMQDCGACSRGKVGAKRQWYESGNYAYRYEFAVASSKRASAKSVMKVFQANPGRIFPFTVSGCKEFTNRSSCTLANATGTGIADTARVWVTTTETSVTFTVMSNGYFDPPGSKITFSTFERDGLVYLQQETAASQTNLLVTMFVDLGSYVTWTNQATNLYGMLQ